MKRNQVPHLKCVINKKFNVKIAHLKMNVVGCILAECYGISKKNNNKTYYTVIAQFLNAIRYFICVRTSVGDNYLVKAFGRHLEFIASNKYAGVFGSRLRLGNYSVCSSICGIYVDP